MGVKYLNSISRGHYYLCFPIMSERVSSTTRYKKRKEVTQTTLVLSIHPGHHKTIHKSLVESFFYVFAYIFICVCMYPNNI